MSHGTADNKITDLGTSNSVTVTKQDADDIYGFEQFECYIEDGNEIVNIGFVLFLLDPNQVTTETTISKNTPAVSLDNTVEDLTNRTEEDMMRVRNLGRKSLEEVIAKLESLDLSLRKEDE